MTAGGRNPRLGILLKVGSVLGFTLMGACVKAGAAVVPVAQVAFFRSFFALLTVLVVLAWRGELPRAMLTANPWGHLWRGLLGLAAMVMNFLALAWLPLPDAIALGYAMPLFLTIFAALFLGEVVRSYRWTAVLVGLAGVLVILWPRLSFLRGAAPASSETYGALCALCGAMAVALGSAVTSRLVIGERTTTVVFYFSAITSLALLPTLPFGWLVPDGVTLLILIASGVLGGVAQLLLTQCYRYADTSTIAPFEYSSMLFGILLGYVLFSEVPTGTMLTGSAIVIGAGLMVLWREHARSLERRPAAAWPWAMIGADEHDGG